MVAYVRIRDRNPDCYTDPAVRCKIIEAKLKHLLGRKPNFVQLMLVKSLVPTYLAVLTWRDEYEKTGNLHPEYNRTFVVLRTSLTQLVGSGVIGGKRKQAPPPKSSFDLGAALDG